MNFDFTTCRLALRDEDGFVRCQPDPLGSPDKGSAANHEAFLPFGLGGRAKAPENGVGGHLLVMRHGDLVMTLPGHDPRWMAARPDFGDGGASLCATTGTTSAPTAPYVAFFGEDGAAAEGLFRVYAPTSAGTTTIEINPSTGDVTITHPGGAVVVVKAATVELGAATGGGPLMKYTEFAAAWATLTSNGAALGLVVPPLAGVATTKVNGT